MTYPIFSKLLHCLFRYHNVNDDFFYCCGYGVSYSHDNVSFPTNSNEVKLKLYPYNDALPENDEEFTVILEEVEKSTCDPDWSHHANIGTHTLTIKDDDKWKIDLSGEEDAENGIILYEEGTTSTIYTLTRVDDGTNRFGDLTYAIDVTLGLIGTASDSDYSTYLDNVSARLAQTFAALQGQKAVYNPGFQLSWKFYVGAEGVSKSRDAGESTSCLYVTYDTPQTTNLYHSVVHIGCATASGVTAATTGNADQPVFDAIWAKFSGNNICLYSVVIENGAVNDSKSGNELYYYGIAAAAPVGWTPYYPLPFGATNQYSVARQYTSIQGSQKLLQYHDGKCGDWAYFFLDIAKTQGIKSDKIAIARIQVNNPYFVLAVPAGLGKHHGQNPLERSWGDHAIIVYNDQYYDTSYGIYYGGIISTANTFASNIEKMGKGTSSMTVWEDATHLSFSFTVWE